MHSREYRKRDAKNKLVCFMMAEDGLRAVSLIGSRMVNTEVCRIWGQEPQVG